MQLSEPEAIKAWHRRQTWYRGPGNGARRCSIAEARRRTAVGLQAARPATHIGGVWVR